MMAITLEMDAVLLDCVTRGTVFYLVVWVIIGSILRTEHRFLIITQYERNSSSLAAPIAIAILYS